MKYTILFLLAAIVIACNSNPKSQSMGLGGGFYTDSATSDTLVEENDAVIATRRFFDALKKKDAKEIQSLLDEKLLKDSNNKNFNNLKDSLNQFQDYALDLSSLDKEGAAGSVYATVDMNVKAGNKSLQTETILKKSNLDTLAKWKVYAVKLK